ncbi:branched-chain amino acid ABC transporter substrate-binding protein [Terrabacter tumescens]|uniref:Branched-chain amino acid ABC transporter substrate-binding protein n=1 Tax=Terrabacter tumescens TaxID=60443 RepID=A0ABQ2I2P0_9MICO|nr:ABC transporter substrate-binding protein [Terrabacter tumescens]GGM98521.1 branched-chain amino acid ABC transporter substrate-binding protein [Terrabacter tumescens]
MRASYAVRMLALATVATTGLAGCVASKSSETTPPASGSTGVARGTGGAAAAGGEVRIGVVMAKTGFMSPYDTPALQALQLEVEKQNATGGIGGSKIVLDVVDTGTKMDRYASAAGEVLDRGAKVLLVTCDYDVSSPAAIAAEGKNVLNIAPCVGDPVYGPKGGLKIGFSMGDGTPGESSIMAEFAHDKGWKSAVTLKDTSIKYTQNQCDIFTKRFQSLGGTIAGAYDYKQGDSIKETVSKISSGTKPDVIVNCGYNPGGGQVTKELRDGGVDTPIVSGFGMDGDFWLGAIPGLKDYFIVTYAAKDGNDPDPAVNETANAYKAKYGKFPDVGSFVTGPSTIQAIKAAYDKAGSWDGDKLAAAMESFKEVPLMAGPTSFTPQLHISVDRPMRVLQVKDGKLAVVEKRAPQQVVTLG